MDYEESNEEIEKKEEILQEESVVDEEIKQEEPEKEEQEETKNTHEPVQDEEVLQEEEQKIDKQEDMESEPMEQEGEIFKKVPVKKKRTVKAAVFAVTIVSLIIILMLISTVFALANIGNNKILDGVTVKGISLVGLSKEDAKLELEDAIETELQKNILLKYNEYETTLVPQQIEASYNIDKAVEEAYNVGRSGNIVKNNFDILFAMLFGKEISIDFSYNDESLTKICEDISKKLPGAMKDNSYYIEGSNLIITKGTPGIAVKIEECKTRIINQIKNLDKTYVEIPVMDSIPSKLNIDKIYEEVKKEPKDAYYTENPFTIHPHENGVDFAITLEEARQLLLEDKAEYEIPLEFREPAITTNKIGAEAFPNQLSYFSTKYDASNINRSTNLELASAKIDGVVLMPGEEFSYNKVVGERTIAAGYKEAAIYSGGQVVDGLGGGICQISSTLYNVVVQANLDVTERSNHQFITSYVGAGKDATVVYGAIDFKFVNSRKYPIKIVSSVKNGVVQMWIYGVKEEVEYDVKIETELISSIPYSTKYIEDSSLEAGVEVIQQYGAAGCKSIAYKVCRLNGAVVSKTVLSNDTYSAMTRIIRRGTKNANPVKSTAPDNGVNEQ